MAIAQTGFSQYTYTSFVGNPGNPGALNTDEDDGSAGWTQLISAGSNIYSASQSIPFAFEFGESAVTSFKAASPGYLTFDVSATGTPSTTFASLPSVNLPDNTICAWGFTLEGTNDVVFSKTFGTSPNRQLWVRWHSASTPGNPDSFNYFSIVLEETTNNIYVVDMWSDNLASPPYVPVSLTIGVQIDNAVAVEVNGSPNISPINIAGVSTSVDNDYYQFTPDTGGGPGPGPGAIDLCLITVDRITLRNTLVWENSDPSIDSFNIYREISGFYQKVGSVPRDSLTQFVDHEAPTDYISSSYKISGVDTAGEGALGNPHTSINLRIGPDSTWLYWNLYWNSYVGFNVAYYRILRDYYGTGDYAFYDSIPGNLNQWTDSVPSWFDSATYILEAFPPGAFCTAGSGADYFSIESNPANVRHVGVSLRRPERMDLKLYPNPSEGLVTVSTYLQNETHISLGLFDLLGRSVQQWEFNNGKGLFEKALNINELPKGMYVLRIQTANQFQSKKLILK